MVYALLNKRNNYLPSRLETMGHMSPVTDPNKLDLYIDLVIKNLSLLDTSVPLGTQAITDLAVIVSTYALWMLYVVPKCNNKSIDRLIKLSALQRSFKCQQNDEEITHLRMMFEWNEKHLGDYFSSTNPVKDIEFLLCNEANFLFADRQEPKDQVRFSLIFSEKLFQIFSDHAPQKLNSVKRQMILMIIKDLLDDCDLYQAQSKCNQKLFIGLLESVFRLNSLLINLYRDNTTNDKAFVSKLEFYQSGLLFRLAKTYKYLSEDGTKCCICFQELKLLAAPLLTRYKNKDRCLSENELMQLDFYINIKMDFLSTKTLDVQDVTDVIELCQITRELFALFTNNHDVFAPTRHLESLKNALEFLIAMDLFVLASDEYKQMIQCMKHTEKQLAIMKNTDCNPDIVKLYTDAFNDLIDNCKVLHKKIAQGLNKYYSLILTEGKLFAIEILDLDTIRVQAGSGQKDLFNKSRSDLVKHLKSQGIKYEAPGKAHYIDIYSLDEFHPKMLITVFYKLTTIATTHQSLMQAPPPKREENLVPVLYEKSYKKAKISSQEAIALVKGSDSKAPFDKKCPLRKAINNDLPKQMTFVEKTAGYGTFFFSANKYQMDYCSSFDPSIHWK